MLPIMDVILIVILFGFIFYGLFFGFIRTLGLFLGLIIGAILASRMYLWVFDIISPVFLGYDNLGKVIVFLILFLLINKLIDIGANVLEKIFNLISIIPFLKSINRLAGAVLGFFTGGLMIGLILFVISKYALLDFFLGRWLVDSVTAPLFLSLNNIMLPLLPEVLKKINGLI